MRNISYYKSREEVLKVAKEQGNGAVIWGKIGNIYITYRAGAGYLEIFDNRATVLHVEDNASKIVDAIINSRDVEEFIERVTSQ